MGYRYALLKGAPLVAAGAAGGGGGRGAPEHGRGADLRCAGARTVVAARVMGGLCPRVTPSLDCEIFYTRIVFQHTETWLHRR